MHKPEEFIPLIKHEVAHVFMDIISENKALPMWLKEGLAESLSVTCKVKNYEGLYLEDDFYKKLAMPWDWENRIKRGGYKISYLFVTYLIEKFGAKKIINLMKVCDKNYTERIFAKCFEKIYTVSLEKIADDFLKEI